MHSNTSNLEKEFFSKLLSDDIIIYHKMYMVDNNISDELLKKYPNSNFIIFLHDSLFKHILTNNDTSKTINTEINFDNFKKYFNKLPINTKYIYFDNNGETSPYPITFELINDWLKVSNYHYFISSRYRRITHSNAIVGLSYLPILYMFWQQNFIKFPMLEYSKPSNPKYNYITYLGQSYKKDKIEGRLELLNMLFDGNLNNIKYKSDGFEITENLFGQGKPAHFWNILNSLSAKIQIIFETIDWQSKHNILQYDIDSYFFTEKIMKCFILPHPYILIVNKKWLNELEEFGFKFPPSTKAETTLELKEVFKNINTNIDLWIDENMEYFEHNQKTLYELSKSINLPHHNFLNKLL